ncbi:T9SS type A sorting domain-containing protein [Polaribacter marinivivus]|uniref:T9SS type A sorting domain-containing protein n=1 Tax=Polaribacter marinivivus TaxID=1524260 RepID=UPI003D341072
MKTKLLLTLSLLITIVSFSQSLSVTSLSANPAEVNSEVTVNFQYSNNNPNDIVYVGLELLNSDGSWAATIAEAFVNPLGNSGTDLTANTSFTIPANTVATADLTNGQYYRLKVELNAENWGGWLAGDYPNFEVAAAGTLSLENLEILNNISVYPNPANNFIQLKGLLDLKNTKIEILDILGKKVYNAHSIKNKKISLNSLKSGIYILNIMINKQSKSFKIIKN